MWLSGSYRTRSGATALHGPSSWISAVRPQEGEEWRGGRMGKEVGIGKGEGDYYRENICLMFIGIGLFRSLKRVMLFGGAQAH